MQIWNALIWNSWQRQAQSQQAFPLQQNYPILPYGYAVQPPPPVLPYQPPVIPTYQSHWNNSGSSVKTVSDVENYMHMWESKWLGICNPGHYSSGGIETYHEGAWYQKRIRKRILFFFVQCPTQSTQQLMNLNQSRNRKMIFYLRRVQRLKPSLNRSLPLLMITSLHLNHSIHFQ